MPRRNRRTIRTQRPKGAISAQVMEALNQLTEDATRALIYMSADRSQR